MKVPVLSCPFPEGHVYWGELPVPACPLCDTVICISLLMAVLWDSRMVLGWAGLSCCEPSGLRQEESSEPGPLAGSQLWLLVCRACV